jgi:glycosyltransferase involved in cell wall biosynthesis
MKLLVDAQCMQSQSALRGIGRYTLSFVRALVSTRQGHQVELLLNGGADPIGLLRAREALETFLPAEALHVFDAPWPWSSPRDEDRRPIAQAAYAAAVRSIGPDALLVCSVFEDDDETVLSLKSSPADPPTAAVLHDLMPAVDPGTYLLGPSAPRYWRRLADLQRCDALLSNSRYSASQATQVLGSDCPVTTTVWGGPYPSGDFHTFESQHDDEPGLQLPASFVLTVGGDHPRKNLDRLVEAWSFVPPSVRAGGPLVIACRLSVGTRQRLIRLARRLGLREGELVLTGGVSEATLQGLYQRASAFVFASLEEGLGMPPLEAMASGCPTVLARSSALIELADDLEVYMDPADPADMARVIERALVDADFRERLLAVASRTAGRFTWTATAETAWDALGSLPPAGGKPATTSGRTMLASDVFALEALASSPAPVLLDAPVPDGDVTSLGLPVLPRALLAPATALLACDDQASARALRQGVLDVPVLHEPWALERVEAHDFYRELSRSLCTLVLPDRLAQATVDAVCLPPRWTLERPRPCWLLLSGSRTRQGPLQLALDAGVDLVVAETEAVFLSRLVDVVLISASEFGAHASVLLDARCRGTRVVALQDDTFVTTATWCEDLPLGGAPDEPGSWPHLVDLAAEWGRSTGWPWRA